MVTFGLNYDVKPGREKEFEEVTLKTIEAMQGVQGHRETRLYRDVTEPTSYMIYSDWETREDFMAFIQSEAFKSVQAGGRDMLSEPPRHNVYVKGAMEGPGR